MSYSTGSINNAAPSATLMSTLQPLIDAHPAWVFVETVVGSVSTNVTDVFKCLGTVNSFGTDFYVGLCRSGASAGTAVFGITVGETYDSSLKKFGKGAVFCSYSTALTVEADFSYLTARHVANETTLVSLTDGNLRASAHPGYLAGLAPGTANTNFTYYLSVSNDRLVIATTAGFGVYAGLYDSFHSTALEPFPLTTVACLPAGYNQNQDVRLNSSYSGGACSRDAGLAGSFTGAFRVLTSNHPWTYNHGAQRNNWASAATSKETISGKWWPSRIVLIPESRAGGLKGLLKPDIVLMDMGEVSEVVGDVLTIDGVLYTCIYGTWTYYTVNDATGAINRAGSIWISQGA